MGAGSNEGQSDASFSQCNPCNSDTAPPPCHTLQAEALKDARSTRHLQGEGDDDSGSDHFLHLGWVKVEDIHQYSGSGPGIGEGELQVVHCMINWRKQDAEILKSTTKSH